MLVTATLRGAGDVTGGGEQLEVGLVGRGSRKLKVVTHFKRRFLSCRDWTFRVEIIRYFRVHMG